MRRRSHRARAQLEAAAIQGDVDTLRERLQQAAALERAATERAAGLQARPSTRPQRRGGGAACMQNRAWLLLASLATTAVWPGPAKPGLLLPRDAVALQTPRYVLLAACP